MGKLVSEIENSRNKQSNKIAQSANENDSVFLLENRENYFNEDPYLEFLVEILGGGNELIELNLFTLYKFNSKWVDVVVIFA